MPSGAERSGAEPGSALRRGRRGAAMGFLHQLHLLLWKNVTLKRRSPVSVGEGLEGLGGVRGERQPPARTRRGPRGGSARAAGGGRVGAAGAGIAGSAVLGKPGWPSPARGSEATRPPPAAGSGCGAERASSPLQGWVFAVPVRPPARAGGQPRGAACGWGLGIPACRCVRSGARLPGAWGCF